MEHEVHIAHSLDDLQQAAIRFFRKFENPGVFCFLGEMGAGKTTFITALCRLLGAYNTSSPTFSIINEYTAADGTLIYHLDLYRVKSMEEALDFGLEEYLERRAWIFIEWPQVAERLMPAHSHVVTISVHPDDHGAERREIIF